VYESTGKGAPGVHIALRPKITAGSESNLMEDAFGVLKAEGNSVVIDLRPFEIKTIRLWLGGL
jgi:hypothetical protein